MTEDLRALAQEAIAAWHAREDPDYPKFHVAPPVGRLNDPNGLVVRDGVYHAFYQFSPFHPDRALVYWGHASSPDLTRWQDHGPAIVPDSWYDRSGAYSGNALVSGDEVLFHYTGNVRRGDGGRETYQCLVTSSDLATFVKLADNPVISGQPEGYTAHFRDPQVWADPDGGFRMCIGAQRADETGCALLFRSDDLRSWRLEGELRFPDAGGRFDAFGYMWECPSLIRVPDVDGERMHDVLVFCPQGIEPSGEGFENIFACGYVVGRLDGADLRDTGDFFELDRGFEFYAPQTFAREPDASGPVLLAAWLGTASEDHQPSVDHGWVHTLSVARELRVRDGRLLQRPVVNLGAGRDATPTVSGELADGEVALDTLAGSRSFALGFTLDPAAADGWGLRIGTDASHVDFAVTGNQLVVDRATTRYPHGGRRTVTLPDDRRLRVEVFHDRSVTEVFLAEGAVSFSMRSYLAEGAGGVRLRAVGAVALTDVSAARFD